VAASARHQQERHDGKANADEEYAAVVALQEVHQRRHAADDA